MDSEASPKIEDVSGFNRRIFRVCMVAALLGTLFVVWTFYPGYLFADGLAQLTQARRGFYGDGCPPFTAFLWKWVDRLFPDGGPILLQNLIFWFGLAGVASLTQRNRFIAPFSIFLFGLFPSILFQLPILCKDTLLVGTLVLAIAILLYADLYQKKAAWFGGVLALLTANLFRHNAITAVIPLAIWAGWVSWSLFFSGYRKALTTCLMGTTLSGLAVLISISVKLALMGPESVHLFQITLMQDLVGISISTETVHLPEYALKNPASNRLETLKKLYYYADGQTIFVLYPDDTPEGQEAIRAGKLPLSSNPTEVRQLERKWLSTVLRHPIEYLRVRLRISKTLIGWENDEKLPKGVLIFDDSPNPLGFKFKHTPWNEKVNSIIFWPIHSLIFKPWAYLLLTLILTLVSPRFLSPSGRAALIAVSASSLLSEAALFGAAFHVVFKYSEWSVVATFVVILLLGLRRNIQAIGPHPLVNP